MGIALVIAGILCIGWGVYLLISDPSRKKMLQPETNVPVNVPIEDIESTYQHDTVECITLNEQKGRAFEEYIIKHFDLLNRRYIELLDWKSDKYVDGISPISSRNPDLLIGLKQKGIEVRFAIECKWRSSFKYGCIKWASEDKIKIYNQYSIDEQVPVFVAIGIGGEPSSPDKLYIVPLRVLSKSTIYESELQPFANPVDGYFFYDEIHKILRMLHQ